MSEQELRRYRCCFTGHRPERLGMPELEAIWGLKKEIRTAVSERQVLWMPFTGRPQERQKLRVGQKSF